MSDVKAAYRDETLADLANVQVTYDPATGLATLTIDAEQLSSILTNASIQSYDSKPNKPIDPESSYADVAIQNAQDSMIYFWLLRDHIEIATARLTTACGVAHDNTHTIGRGKEKEVSIASDRRHRDMQLQWDREQWEKTGVIADVKSTHEEGVTFEALTAWADSTHAKPLSQTELVSLLQNVKTNSGQPVAWEDTMRLYSTYADRNRSFEKMKEGVDAAKKALGALR